MEAVTQQPTLTKSETFETVRVDFQDDGNDKLAEDYNNLQEELIKVKQTNEQMKENLELHTYNPSLSASPLEELLV